LATPVVEEIPDSIRTLTRRVWHGPDVEVYGAYPYPDAGTLSLTDWAVGELAIRNLETGEIRHLTTHNPSSYETGSANYSVVSPDGRMVAYDWLDWSGPSPATHSLRIMEVSMGEERVLWGEAGWGVRPHAWFPDGESVLAVRVLVPRSGSDSGGGPSGGPQRSASQYELVRFAVRDGSAEVLSELASGPETATVSRDGRFVAFDQRPGSGEPYAIRLLRVADGSLETLLSGPSDLHLYGWSPSSDHLLFWSERGGTPGLWIVPVRNGRVAGAAQLVLPGAWNLSPVGFADAGRFFYSVQVGGLSLYVATLSDDYDTAVSDAAPTVPVTPSRLSHPDWSPDGRLLAYIEDRRVVGGVGGPPPELVLRNVQTGETRIVELSDGLQPFATPRWMPDGRSLLLVAKRGFEYGIYRVDPQTGETEPVVTEGIHTVPVGAFGVSPDGRYLYYRTKLGGFGGTDLRLFRRDLSDGSEVEIGGRLVPDLCPEPHPSPCLFWDLAVSPDGRMLAVNMRGSVAVMNVDGTGRRRLTDAPDPNATIISITWTPDGRSLLFTRVDQWGGDLNQPEVHNIHNVYRVGLAGGEPQRVEMGTEELIGGLPALAGNPRFHPDGRRVVFVAGEVQFELWMMEDFLPEYGGR
jgi:Tol biopolymer transport system component